MGDILTVEGWMEGYKRPSGVGLRSQSCLYVNRTLHGGLERWYLCSGELL